MRPRGKIVNISHVVRLSVRYKNVFMVKDKVLIMIFRYDVSVMTS